MQAGEPIAAQLPLDLVARVVAALPADGMVGAHAVGRAWRDAVDARLPDALRTLGVQPAALCDSRGARARQYLRLVRSCSTPRTALPPGRRLGQVPTAVATVAVAPAGAPWVVVTMGGDAWHARRRGAALRLVPLGGAEPAARAAAVTRCGKRAAIGRADGTVCLHALPDADADADAAAGARSPTRCGQPLGHREAVRCLAFSDPGSWLAVGHQSGRVQLHDVSAARPRPGPALTLAAWPQALSLRGSPAIDGWLLAATVLNQLSCARVPPMAAGLADHGGTAGAGAGQGAPEPADGAAAGTGALALAATRPGVLVPRAGGTLPLLAGAPTGKWPPEASYGAELLPFGLYLDAEVRLLAASHDGRVLVTLAGCSLRAWRAHNPYAPASPLDLPAAADEDPELLAWHAGEANCELDVPPQRVTALAVAPAGTHLLAGGAQGGMWLWHLAAPDPRRPRPLPPGRTGAAVTWLGVLPGGTWAVAGDAAGHLLGWDFGD